MMEKKSFEEQVKENLKKFDEIWNLEANLKDYSRSSELSNIATWLLSKKLTDSFLINELTEKEQSIFSNAMIIANTKN